MIEAALLRWMRFSKRLDPCCPNKLVRGWYEADFLGVTRSEFWHEFEIKRSTGDYHRDFDKGRGSMLFRGPWLKGPNIRAFSTWNYYRPWTPTKHQILSEKNERGPNYFWFVIPLELKGKIDPPKHAGLVVIHPPKKEDRHSRAYVDVVRQAPRRHKKKVSERFKHNLMIALAFRYYTALETIENLKKMLGNAGVKS